MQFNLGLGTFQIFLAVSLTVSSNRKREKFQVAVNFKGKNGTFVSLTAFTFFFKLPLVNYLNFINNVDGKFSTIVNGLSNREWHYK